MSPGFHENQLSSTEAVDIIEKIVYAYLKPLGFRKFGRTLYRFVDGDMSQVVNLQNGCPAKGYYDILWVNLGIRIPECMERKFTITEPPKKYYHEYECNIRTRLGCLADGKDTFYDLRKNPEEIGSDIVERLKQYATPVFSVLDSRDAVLRHRAEYARFDQMNNHLILLEEAMIMGRRGDLTAAARLFGAYYQNVLAQFHRDSLHGTKIYLKKGEKVVYHNAKTGETDTITADKNGYVTIYGANRSHLTYLEELAQKLGIPLCNT